MGTETGIQWTEKTWNVLIGCSKASAGCKNCYAEKDAGRVILQLRGTVKSEKGKETLQAYEDAVEFRGETTRWSGKVFPIFHKFLQPLSWTKPSMIFVNSMSDMFHPTVPFELIAGLYGVMAACPQHTFQVLTKHPDRAAEFFKWLGDKPMLECASAALDIERDVLDGTRLHSKDCPDPDGVWPLPNVWLLTSVENDEWAHKRIPHLLKCPAAVRGVSYEPALGPVDFSNWGEELDWVIVGGESGPKARPFKVDWADSVINQGREQGFAVFVKQLGRYPMKDDRLMVLDSKKGGDMEEWAPHLRVREFPVRSTDADS